MRSANGAPLLIGAFGAIMLAVVLFLVRAPLVVALLVGVIGVALLAVLVVARPRPTITRTLPPVAPAPPAPVMPAAEATAPPVAPVAPPSVAPTIAEAAAPAAPSVMTYLPAPAPIFVGREQEFEELEAALRRAHGPMATAVIGPPGGGKHSVISQAIEAHRQAGTFADGYSWHVATDLHGDRGLRRLLIEVLDRLGGPAVAMTATLRMGEAAVADLVRGKRMVFWLDDVPADFPMGRALSTLTARDAAGVGPTLIISSGTDWAMPEINEIFLDAPQLDEALNFLREWMELSGRSLDFTDYDAAKAICVNLSDLSLAIRLAAGYAAQSGVKLPKLAADLGSAVYPPGDLLRTGEKTIAFVEATLFPKPRRVFAALAVFEEPLIDLADASAVAAAVAGNTVAEARTDLE
ncbi:MAG: hypothetical protein H0X24_23620, partial [Ktedonobacterales bacterium]|nr:hypothetical protein [Ktedonobacterales bacterium]